MNRFVCPRPPPAIPFGGNSLNNGSGNLTPGTSTTPDIVQAPRNAPVPSTRPRVTNVSVVVRNLLPVESRTPISLALYDINASYFPPAFSVDIPRSASGVVHTFSVPQPMTWPSHEMAMAVSTFGAFAISTVVHFGR